MNIWLTFLSAAIAAGTPLLFATLGGILTEKSGHLNLGIEGMLLMGAIAGFATGVATASAALALVMAAAAGAAGALIYAFLTVTLRANHVVTGLTLSIFGSGLANFAGTRFVGVVMPAEIKQSLTQIKLPLLADIPVLGPILFTNNFLVFSVYIIAVLAGIYMYKTPAGLNLRMVGENPAAADAAGIAVSRYKYAHILAGGALCGIGGAYISMDYLPTWQNDITAGIGWIAVALVIFTAWNPYKAILGSIFFGGLSIIKYRLQGFQLPISPHLLEMLPYVATAAALIISSIKKSRENQPPAALGTPYFREDR